MSVGLSTERLHGLRSHLVILMLAALWVLLLAGVALTQPWILSGYTVTSVLQFTTLLALVSLGQGLVVIGGSGVDLSVGGNVSLSAILGGLALQAGWPAWTLPLVCTASGLLLGAFNGLLVTRLRITPLILTLGSFYLFSGLALALTNGGTIPGVPAWLTGWGRGTWGVIPAPFLVLVVPAFALGILVLWQTSWGRWIYAMGASERAAHLSGIPVDRLRMAIFSVTGALCGLAAFVSLAWLGSARPNIGLNLELEALTAAMLGGLAIAGGRGAMPGVLAAALLIVTLKTVMLQAGLDTVWQVGTIGLLLIAALFVDRYALHKG
ncbi:ABC transporter permease [Acidimangrovimonas sediminis]|uniref:ABC transporter permease n=1 Tax=Acidimangrovimonas sediminis TaxID=2056283 RepID=UPI000C80F555|nr:ABC transporter permease [Acidimangrovimonas sediminis]